MYRSNLIAFVVVSVLFTGCYSSHELPDNVELVIEIGSTESVTLSADSACEETMSALLVSHSTRAIDASVIQTHAHGVLGDNLDGDVAAVRLTLGDGTTVSGTYRFGTGSAGTILFEEPVRIEAGESVELLLVIDTTPTASNRIEFDLGQYVPGLPSVTGRSLFAVITYADTGEMVPPELVLGNEGFARHATIGE